MENRNITLFGVHVTKYFPYGKSGDFSSCWWITPSSCLWDQVYGDPSTLWRVWSIGAGLARDLRLGNMELRKPHIYDASIVYWEPRWVTKSSDRMYCNFYLGSDKNRVFKASNHIWPFKQSLCMRYISINIKYKHVLIHNYTYIILYMYIIKIYNYNTYFKYYINHDFLEKHKIPFNI